MPLALAMPLEDRGLRKLLLFESLRMLWARCGMRLCDILELEALLQLLATDGAGEDGCGSEFQSSDSESSHGSPIASTIYL